MEKQIKIVIIKVKKTFDQSVNADMYTAYCNIEDNKFSYTDINREKSIANLIMGEPALKDKNYGVVDADG